MVVDDLFDVRVVDVCGQLGWVISVYDHDFVAVLKVQQLRCLESPAFQNERGLGIRCTLHVGFRRFVLHFV